jgi:hypothetical protein
MKEEHPLKRVTGHSNEPLLPTSQISMRSLVFVQIQVAVMLAIVTLVLELKGLSFSIVAATFILVTLTCVIVGTICGYILSIRYWLIASPACGILIGLFTSALSLAAISKLPSLLWSTLIASTLLIGLVCWLGRLLPQEETV